MPPEAKAGTNEYDAVRPPSPELNSLERTIVERIKRNFIHEEIKVLLEYNERIARVTIDTQGGKPEIRLENLLTEDESGRPIRYDVVIKGDVKLLEIAPNGSPNIRCEVEGEVESYVSVAGSNLFLVLKKVNQTVNARAATVLVGSAEFLNILGATVYAIKVEKRAELTAAQAFIGSGRLRRIGKGDHNIIVGGQGVVGDDIFHLPRTAIERPNDFPTVSGSNLTEFLPTEMAPVKFWQTADGSKKVTIKRVTNDLGNVAYLITGKDGENRPIMLKILGANELSSLRELMGEFEEKSADEVSVFADF